MVSYSGLQTTSEVDAPSFTQTSSARIPTPEGTFTLHYFRNNLDAKEHLALTLGDIANQANVITRIHSECFTGDVLGSLRCDCGPQLHRAMEMIAEEGQGIVLYLRQEGRGIGLEEKLRAYTLQDEGYDTVDANLMLGHGADERDYTAAAHMLCALQVSSVRLMTNNPLKIESLSELGITVTERVPIQVPANEENQGYLATKVKRMRHLLRLDKLTKRTDGRSAPLLDVPDADIPEPDAPEPDALEPSTLDLTSANLNSTEVDSTGIRPASPASSISSGYKAASGYEEDSSYIPPSPELANGAQPLIHPQQSHAHLFQKLRRQASTLHQQTGLPHVTLSYAQSLDGSIAAQSGQSFPISGKVALQWTHSLRASHQAILIGIGTALADDPSLTVRQAEGDHPTPVVVDSTLRLPVDARLFSLHPEVLIATTEMACEEKAAALTESGATILRLPADQEGWVDLGKLLTALGQRGISSVMVEGGAQMITSFWRQGLANMAVITVAPLLLGGVDSVAGPLYRQNGQQTNGTGKVPRLAQLHVYRAGNDTIFWGEVGDA